MLLTHTSCNHEDEAYARVTVNGVLLTASVQDFTAGDRSDFNGDIDASFTDNGGSATRIFSWNNKLSTADYNADITAGSKGSFRMTAEDANGNAVLTRAV